MLAFQKLSTLLGAILSEGQNFFLARPKFRVSLLDY
jgi:hypothetical protein